MTGFYRILQYVRNYSVLTALNIFLNLLNVIFSVASFAAIVPFLNILFGNTEKEIPPMPEYTGLTNIDDYMSGAVSHHFIKSIHTEGEVQTLFYLCILIAIVFFFKNLFRYLALYVTAPIRSGVVRDIRRNMYDKMLQLPLSFYSKGRKGDLLSRMTSDLKEIEYSVVNVLEVAFREPITIIVYLGVMLYISPELTLFVLGMLLIMALVVGVIGKNLKKESKEAQDKMGSLVSIIEETLSGIKIIKAFSAEKEQNEKFDRENDQHHRMYMSMNRRRSLASPLSEFLAIVVVSMVLWYGGRLVLTSEFMTGSWFIFFILTFALLIPPAKSFSTAFYSIRKGLAASDRINEVLDTEETILEAPVPKPIKAFNEKIEYQDVSFAYYNYDNKLVLEDVSVTIKKGRVLALVGQSGSGKSTFVDLLPRFYDVLGGEIRIDGVNIREYKMKDLRKLMGIVTQEAILFNDTVHNNIAFGIGTTSREEVERAAKIANAHDFIMKMERGYDTSIGDRGGKLSGGERQRLTIARAVLNDPPILIMDEATSSLDTESEKLVQDALYKLMENRTTIVIAHRLSTIQYADEIVVLQEGKIIERGNHIGLMAKNGTYKKLVDLQAF